MQVVKYKSIKTQDCYIMKEEKKSMKLKKIITITEKYVPYL